MALYFMTWPEVDTYLSSWEIAKKVGEKTKTIVAPPLCYGLALHHMAFPGSAAFKPSTYLLVVKELVQSFAKTGFDRFFFINGHGGNIPTLQASFSEILHDNPRLRFQL
ncbi:MAG: creatininase family protein, partial [Pseudobdellovibrionaceae bacterium]